MTSISTQPVQVRSGSDIPLASVTRARIKELGQLSPLRSSFELAATWIQIIAAIALCLSFPSALSYAGAFVFIGARQYALLILLHDASHTLLHPNRRINDLVALWLIAAPCGSSFINSRLVHLSHHRNLGDPIEDPDYFHYCAASPSEKRSLSAFLFHFVKLVAGGQIVHTLFKGQSKGKVKRNLAATAFTLAPVACAQLLILGTFALAGSTWSYFVIWFLPLVTLTVLLNGLRVFCDHANLPPHGSESADGLIVSYFSNPLERFFIAPFEMNYHAEHHFFPFVPHYNLPEVRRLMQLLPEYRDQVQWRQSYARFVVSFLRRSPAQ